MTAIARPLAFAAARLEAAVERIDALAESAPDCEFDQAYVEYSAEVRSFAAVLRQTTGMPLELLARLNEAA